jgi:hypothetical protein
MLKFYYGLLTLGAVVALVCLIMMVRIEFRLERGIKTQIQSALDMQKIVSYDKGFGDGVNAVIKYVRYDTNTHKITLEMTNVLSEMKP